MDYNRIAQELGYKDVKDALIKNFDKFTYKEQILMRKIGIDPSLEFGKNNKV